MDTMEYIEAHDPMIEGEFMLTTTDNPYDPFTDYESWNAFDEQNGSDELSDEENELAISHAVSDILNLFPGLYRIARPN